MSASPHPSSGRIVRTAYASIAVAFLVMAIKYAAYLRTGSVALYSDALESIVNVITAFVAVFAIRVSMVPPDRGHPFGHHKAEYFSAVLEGALIVVAALLILREAWDAFLNPRQLTQPLEGVLINGAATVMNAGWSYFLISRGGIWRSPALEADGWHLATDVATSVGVLVGLTLAALTGWQILDPLLATAVAGNILWFGYRITRQSVGGLMDEAVDANIQERIRAAIKANGGGALQAHDIRARNAGRATFIEFHLVVPGAMTVAESHAICDRIEEALEAEIEGAEVVIHVEPEDKAKSHSRGALEI